MSISNRNSREHDDQSFPAKHKKQIKNLRGLKDSLADESSMEELNEFGLEVSIANIWDEPGEI